MAVGLQNDVELGHENSLVFDDKDETLIVIEWITPQFDFPLTFHLVSDLLQI